MFAFQQLKINYLLHFKEDYKKYLYEVWHNYGKLLLLLFIYFYFILFYCLFHLLFIYLFVIFN